MSPEFAESDLSQRSYLNWGLFIIALVAAIVIVAYGLLASGPETMSVEQALADRNEDFDLRLFEAWEEVDPYLEDCSEMGLILRQIEAKGEYTSRLFLLVPRSGGDGYILINDGGVCWVSGEKKKMEISDSDWFASFLNSGKQPMAPPTSPFRNVGGSWSYAPVMNESIVRGIMLIQHYEE